MELAYALALLAVLWLLQRVYDNDFYCVECGGRITHAPNCPMRGD